MARAWQATELNASSIYHAFGSKRGLFDAAIEDYLECVVRRIARCRAEVAPCSRALLPRGPRAVLDRHVPTLPDGCLLGEHRCSESPGRRDRRAVRAYRAELLAAFTRGAGPDAPTSRRRARAARRDLRRAADQRAGHDPGGPSRRPSPASTPPSPAIQHQEQTHP